MVKLEIGDRVKNRDYDERGFPCCAPFIGIIIGITSLAKGELCYVVRFDYQKDEDITHYGFLKNQLKRITRARYIQERVKFT